MISLTVPLPMFVTQAWVPSEETRVGLAEPGDGLDDRAGGGVQLGDRVAGRFVTQTWLPSEETPLGKLPTVMVWTTAPVAASSSVTVSLPPFVTQTWVPSEETPLGSLNHGDGLDDRAGGGVQLGDRAAVAVRDPDVGAVGGHAAGRAAHGDGLDDCAGGGVQLRHGVAVSSRPRRGCHRRTRCRALATVMVWTIVPVAASSSVTVSLPPFVTQTWVPSEDTP